MELLEEQVSLKIPINMPKEQWSKIQEWQNENKHVLVIIADPKSDSISVSYGGLNAFMKFPMESMEKGVIFNALRKSKFLEAIKPLIAGISEVTGMKGDDISSANFLRSIGGAVKSIGEVREITKINNLIKHEKKNS